MGYVKMSEDFFPIIFMAFLILLLIVSMMGMKMNKVMCTKQYNICLSNNVDSEKCTQNLLSCKGEAKHEGN